VLRLACIAVTALALGTQAAAPPPTLERNVSISGGAAPLRGTLFVPTAGARVPAALILGGSGPTDRNGNQPTTHTDNLKLLAHGLFAAGIATLRIDKRGIGASGPAALAEADLRLDTYVADAKAWLAFLRAQERIGRVFVVGHSEGALIASLAAQGEDLAGLVLIAGIGSPLGTVMRRQLIAMAAPEPLRQRAFDIIAALERGQTTRDVPAELAALLRPSVQPFLISSLTRDPVAALAASTAPALIVQGTTDLQVSVENARLLAASRAGTELAIIDGMNHTLKVAPVDRAAQRPAYVDPDLPLASALVPAVSDFIRRHAE
jgi:alpha-beta hydrolase superfamily lysophospholipase